MFCFIGVWGSCYYLCFILALPTFAQEMIRNAVDWVWSTTVGHADEALTPLILPPYPSQYCFPEAKDIRTKLNSSTDSNRSGNNACRFNLVCGALCFIVWIWQIFSILFTVGPVSTEPPKAKQVAHVRPTQKPMVNPKPTLVVPVISSQNKRNRHRYPVAANGKLLDIAVIDEKPQPQSTKSVKVSVSGQKDSFCPKCSLECDDPWVFCPVCKIVIHKTCILTGCICNCKPHSRHWVRPYLVLFDTFCVNEQFFPQVWEYVLWTLRPNLVLFMTHFV